MKGSGSFRYLEVSSLLWQSAICVCISLTNHSFDKNTQNLQWCQHHFQCRHHCSCRNRPWCRHQRNQSKCSSAGVAFGGIPEIRHRHGTIAGIAPPLAECAPPRAKWPLIPAPLLPGGPAKRGSATRPQSEPVPLPQTEVALRTK